ncbi:hypothetical protein AKJ16_DCAP01570, partial [Drosera capensis]
IATIDVIPGSLVEASTLIMWHPLSRCNPLVPSSVLWRLGVDTPLEVAFSFACFKILIDCKSRFDCPVQRLGLFGLHTQVSIMRGFIQN